VTRFVELSHPLRDGDALAVYPGIGLPAPRIGPILDHDASRDRYGGQAEFYLGRIEIAANTCTYLDAPFHRHRDREDLASLPLSSVAELPGLVVDHDLDGGRSIELADLDASTIAGRAVLIRTGWDARWGTEAYWAGGPFLTAAAAKRLVEGGATLVGADVANVDDTGDLSRPVHTGLLGAAIPIVENLCHLEELTTDCFTFSAVPLAILRGASVPVRAYAAVPEEAS
jgi:kynurenine formamidase